MQVELSKVYPLDGSPESAWDVLQDIEATAGCMPGAEITEKVSDTHYKGKVRVKLGPVSAAFQGDIEVAGVDPDKREIKLLAKGADSKGSSSAAMDLTAVVRPGADTGSELTGDAVVTVNGKLANFGGRMMTQVADQVLGQFADNFAARVDSASPGQGTDSAPADTAHAEPDAANSAEPAEAPQQINALKLGWQALIGYLKSLFGRN